MILSDQDKKLLFKGVLTFLAVGIIIFFYFKGVLYYERWEDSQIYSEEKIVKIYELKVDSITSKNTLLIDSIDILSEEIDSLKSLKIQIQEDNVEEINIIYDNNANNHAEWLNSTVSKLKNNTE